MEERGTKGGEKRALCNQGAARTLRWKKNIGPLSKYEARHGLLSTFTACRRFTRERRRDEESRATRHRVSIARFCSGAGKARSVRFTLLRPLDPRRLGRECRPRTRKSHGGKSRESGGGDRHRRGSKTKRKAGKADATGPRETWPASNYPHTRPEKRLLLIRAHGFPSNSPKRRPRGRSKLRVLGTTHYRRSKFLSRKLNRSPFQVTRGSRVSRRDHRTARYHTTHRNRNLSPRSLPETPLPRGTSN